MLVRQSERWTLFAAHISCKGTVFSSLVVFLQA
jgi:hypothetical protein